MRKTLIAIAIGLTAIAAAACNNNGSPATTTGPLESTTPVESPSMAPLESTMPVESPSGLESPASS